MCGRYYIDTLPDGLEEYFNIRNQLPAPEPNWNVCPTQRVPAVRDAEGRREGVRMRWGLIPFWAKDKAIGYRTINARGDTARTKPAFRAAFKSRRCILPASGFYEWQKTDDGKQPYAITVEDQPVMPFAGLWESWTDKETGETLESCSIVTTEAAEAVRPLHDRMPVILYKEDFATWLTGSPDEAEALVLPYPGELRYWPVSRDVGNVRNNRPDLIAPIQRQDG